MNTAENTTPGKVFILTYYEDDGLREPICKSSYEAAFDEMQRQYNAKLLTHSSKVSYVDGTELCDFCAVISVHDNYFRWEIWQVDVDAAAVNLEASQ